MFSNNVNGWCPFYCSAHRHQSASVFHENIPYTILPLPWEWRIVTWQGGLMNYCRLHHILILQYTWWCRQRDSLDQDIFATPHVTIFVPLQPTTSVFSYFSVTLNGFLVMSCFKSTLFATYFLLNFRICFLIHQWSSALLYFVLVLSLLQAQCKHSVSADIILHQISVWSMLLSASESGDKISNPLSMSSKAFSSKVKEKKQNFLCR